MKSKLKLYPILLLTFILIFSASIKASTLNTPSIQVSQYVEYLADIQRRIFTHAQQLTFPSSSGQSSSFSSGFDSITKTLTNMSSDITAELSNANIESGYASELRLLLNAINYIQNSLYELNLLSQSNNSTDKLIILEKYFNFRVYATNTLTFVTQLLSNS